ncbi:MAG: 3-isopropylmalate dehydratase small subunit [Bacteroidales bacterium]|nr:3-isopropylmalate dehydratase small subunit [Bacteroidales bacterium]
MSFNPIKRIVSPAVLLPLDHVDTDQIIPARFLKATSREGFGKHLFSSWRYQKNEEPDPEFVLNGKNGKGEILLVGENFGCGSSREHAAWALHDYGFRVVVAKSFADIFRGNAMNNGIVPVELKLAEHEELLNYIRKNPEAELMLDLPSETIQVKGSDKLKFNFVINPFRKECLTMGTDLVDSLITRKEEISQFEQNRKQK